LGDPAETETGLKLSAIQHNQNRHKKPFTHYPAPHSCARVGVTPEAIKLFSEEAVFNNIQHNADTATGNTIVNYQFQFNPIEKIVELYDEKVALLERLLQSEREKVELLKAGK